MNKKIMNKKIITVVIIVIIIATSILFYNFKNNITYGTSTVKGYVKQIYLDDSKVLICYDLENALIEEYWGDCYIPVEEKTIISDNRSLESIKKGDYIIVTYSGTLTETFPSEIDGTISISIKSK